MKVRTAASGKWAIATCIALTACAAVDSPLLPVPPEVHDSIRAGPSQTFEGLLVIGTEALFTPSEFFQAASRMRPGKDGAVSLPGWWLDIQTEDIAALAAAIAQSQKDGNKAADTLFRVRLTGSLDEIPEGAMRVFHVTSVLAAAPCKRGSSSLDNC